MTAELLLAAETFIWGLQVSSAPCATHKGRAAKKSGRKASGASREHSTFGADDREDRTTAFSLLQEEPRAVREDGLRLYFA